MNSLNITNYKPKDFVDFQAYLLRYYNVEIENGTLKANQPQTNRHYYTYNQHLLNQVTFLRWFCNVKELFEYPQTTGQ